MLPTIKDATDRLRFLNEPSRQLISPRKAFAQDVEFSFIDILKSN